MKNLQCKLNKLTVFFNSKKSFWLRFLLIFLASLTLIAIIFYPTEVQAAAMIDIDIRDENGEVTTWGWWLINGLAPFFIIGELVKIA